jgi:hypothetical protein
LAIAFAEDFIEPTFYLNVVQLHFAVSKKTFLREKELDHCFYFYIVDRSKRYCIHEAMDMTLCREVIEQEPFRERHILREI